MLNMGEKRLRLAYGAQSKLRNSPLGELRKNSEAGPSGFPSFWVRMQFEEAGEACHSAASDNEAMKYEDVVECDLSAGCEASVEKNAAIVDGQEGGAGINADLVVSASAPIFGSGSSSTVGGT
jgi:hypothetical protein